MTSIKRKPKNSSSDKAAPVSVRKFEAGASGIYFVEFLESFGYYLRIDGGGFANYKIRHGTVGRWGKITRTELMKFVDKLRKKRGLEPFAKR